MIIMQRRWDGITEMDSSTESNVRRRIKIEAVL